MQLISSAFQHNGKIPKKYTCDGDDMSLPMSFKNVPSRAKSLVLIMDDPDIPDFVKKKFSVDMWDHWIVFNIPPSTQEILEGKNPQGVLGKNTAGKNAYGGPCPPDREHRYFFQLYALDTTLSLPEGSTKQEVQHAMAGHIIADATLSGMYQRQ
jgi:Raf kinase inhibitor-like YbhB/YbcL family protein